MLESIKKIEVYSEKIENADKFYNNSISFDAIMMNFIVIGEMVEKLSGKFIQETGKGIDWLNPLVLCSLFFQNFSFYRQDSR